MNVIYSKNFNIDLGILNYVHPFDGLKFQKIHKGLHLDSRVNFLEPSEAASMAVIDNFLSSMMRKKIRDPIFILRALEVPRIPFLSFAYLDRKILSPMRWGVSGTLLAANKALSDEGVFWNLSGGYHHAMQQQMEGFCIYNDVGICYQELIQSNAVSPDDKILIIDTDAHHGNGNAYTFMENHQITILDVYNAEIYPSTDYTRERVDIPVPLPPRTDGQTYLEKYQEALSQLDKVYRLAFVVAGTDTLQSDKLGGLSLSINDVVEREMLTLETLNKLSIPAVFLGGGGYSKESAKSVIQSISACCALSRPCNNP